jgi:uncharacterized protein YbjT (DUF2867 family)
MSRHIRGRMLVSASKSLGLPTGRSREQISSLGITALDSIANRRLISDMNVFITGATGFIGAALTRALIAAGHSVTTTVRAESAAPPATRAILADFVADVSAATWRPRLEGIDIVVNAVGILRERAGQRFAELHEQAPIALFTAAAQAGVRRIIQVSALGADGNATSRYHLTKLKADNFLTALPLEWAIVQPSLVFGEGGTSAKLFSTLASLPFVPIPQPDAVIQPIHLDDVVAAVLNLVQTQQPLRRRIALVGPAPIRFSQFLAALRESMGLRRPIFVRIPNFLMRASAIVGSQLPGALLDRETLSMLRAGNAGNVSDTEAVLGRSPRSIDSFIQTPRAERAAAKLRWLLPLLRISLAVVWIGTGLVSLFVFPQSASYELLTRSGIPLSWAPSMLYGAAVIDISLGVSMLSWHRRRRLYGMQAGLILLYTAIITLRLPEFWAHPYGPVLKNIPLLAMLWLLFELEDR